MKWINFFSNDNISYYTYKLNTEDSIIIHNSQFTKNQAIIILCGSIYIVKTFVNKETLPLVILKKNNILNFNSLKTKFKYYYKLTALEKTYILSFKIPYDSQNKKKISYNLFISMMDSYNKTISQYEKMNEVMSHKYAKNRIIQLILLLCTEFGIVTKKQIQIPFKISQKSLATLSHTQKNNVNKTIKYLYHNTPIKYSNKKNIYIKNIYYINY